MSPGTPAGPTFPDFSGIWRLDPGESHFGFLPPPKFRTDTISHREPRLHMVTHQRDANGTVTVERDLIVGGAPVGITIHGRQRAVRAFRECDSLVIETVYEVSGKPRRLEDRFSLDEKRERLMIHRSGEQAGGTVRQRLQFCRKPADLTAGVEAGYDQPRVPDAV